MSRFKDSWDDAGDGGVGDGGGGGNSSCIIQPCSSLLPMNKVCYYEGGG